jgi:hypothetical protein
MAVDTIWNRLRLRPLASEHSLVASVSDAASDWRKSPAGRVRQPAGASIWYIVGRRASLQDALIRPPSVTRLPRRPG